MTVSTSIPPRSSFLMGEATQAWEYFQERGYPNSKNENWRFSNPEAWLQKDAPRVQKNGQNSLQKFSGLIQPYTTPVFIFNDSVVIPDELPEGVKIVRLYSEIQENPTGETIGGVADFHISPFIAENMALFQDCTVINISEGRKIENPIHIIHLIQAEYTQRIFPRLFLNVGDGSEITIWETELGNDGNPHFINSVTESIIHENAHLKWTTIQQRNKETGQISSFNATLEKNATVCFSSFEFGGGFIRRDINIYLHSIGSECELNSLFVPTGKQHVDISTVVHHESPHCNSRQLVKGILGDKSSGVFRGLANVYKKAEKTDAQQSNKNLILSPKARMNSIPQLEIYEDDVKCTHGSTTGQIDEDSLFYLQSRGINRKDAAKLMVRGFANEVVEKAGHSQLKEKIQTALAEILEEVI